MSADRYKRFEVARPDYLGDEHWHSIDTELARLERALEARDDAQAIGDVKCLVEAVAKATLEIAGSPADSNASFDSTVGKAHGLLIRQPGDQLAYESEYGNLATQASKMAKNLGKIRNEFGGGHGRARQPHVRDEMVDLALDGGLIWTRWALRRLGLFSEGRPDALIRDLVEERQNFYSGTLTRRLQAANLPNLEERHQRALGVAVGQRAMQGTFVVRMGGVDPCLRSDDTETWPAAYRIGLTSGLWFAPDGRPTVSAKAIRDGLTILDPLEDCGGFLDDLVERVIGNTEAGLLGDDESAAVETAKALRERIAIRPSDEASALSRLAEHLDPTSI